MAGIGKFKNIGPYGNIEDDIALGAASGVTVIQQFGENPDVGTSLEDIWTPGGIKTWLTAAATLEAISTSTNDTAAGTHARTIVVEGLDANWAEVSATITMNGTSASTATTQTFIRVNRAYVATSGGYGNSNAGTITIRVSGAGSTQAEISILDGIGAGQSLMLMYSVPAGKVALIHNFQVFSSSGKEVAIVGMFRLNADVTTAPYSPFRTGYRIDTVDSGAVIDFHAPILFPAKTDLVVRAKEVASTAKVSGSFEIWVVDN